MEHGYYNMDCMELLKKLPDKSIELAIVDPPYGDGGVPGKGRTRTGSEAGSTATSQSRWGGWFDRYKSEEQAAPGQLSTAKKS